MGNHSSFTLGVRSLVNYPDNNRPEITEKRGVFFFFRDPGVISPGMDLSRHNRGKLMPFLVRAVQLGFPPAMTRRAAPSPSSSSNHGKRYVALALPDIDDTYLFLLRLVHGSLARAGKVKSQTPKVEAQEKKKVPKGRAKKRILYNRRYAQSSFHFLCRWLTSVL
jgi:small subunit ribosomal protein S30e